MLYRDLNLKKVKLMFSEPNDAYCRLADEVDASYLNKFFPAANAFIVSEERIYMNVTREDNILIGQYETLWHIGVRGTLTLPLPSIAELYENDTTREWGYFLKRQDYAGLFSLNPPSVTQLQRDPNGYSGILVSSFDLDTAKRESDELIEKTDFVATTPNKFDEFTFVGKCSRLDMIYEYIKIPATKYDMPLQEFFWACTYASFLHTFKGVELTESKKRAAERLSLSAELHNLL